MKIAAIYARVSSDQQKEEKTIASQTAALIEFARQENYQVPDEWVFEDEGYSGANLIRPGLERIRDLAAEGQIQSVLALSPDRLSRKYAYQVLLTEELARHGVEMVFIKAPHSGTPEDQLLIQFQGMIAEYERAQILERSRRGKRHRAKQGEVSVLSGAPYGYRYIRKTDESAAYYEIIETEADVVRKVFNWYTVEGLSIGAIARQLTESGLPTRKQRPRWERSVIWAILRNPAYQGRACFGKTAVAARQRITRPLRLRGGSATRNSANHELPREEWIEIPVPALVSEETFACPLLANIYLNELDHLIGEKYRRVRYADDFVILTTCEAEAEQALATVRDKIRLHTRRSQGVGITTVIARLNPILRGWFNYFKHVKKGELKAMDGFVRRRLRSILRKYQKKGRGTGRNIQDHQQWTNAYFASLGLFTMYEAHA